MAIKLERPKQVEALRHLLVRILTLCLLTGAASGLRCYQCFSTDLEPCQPEDLQECPRHLFYNRCATRYRQIDSGEMYVRRECSTGCSDGYDVWNHGLNVRLSAHSRHFPVSIAPEVTVKTVRRILALIILMTIDCGFL